MATQESSGRTRSAISRLAFQRKTDPDADFELVVRSLVDGIHARLAGTADEQAARPAASPRSPRSS